MVNSIIKFLNNHCLEAYQKEERRKEDESANRFSYIDDSKVSTSSKSPNITF